MESRDSNPKIQGHFQEVLVSMRYYDLSRRTLHASIYKLGAALAQKKYLAQCIEY